MRQRRVGLVLLCFGSMGIAAAQERAAIPSSLAKQYFAEAAALCKADNGRLWGASLCGAIMFVDPQSHAVVASEADASGKLQPCDGVFVGALPPDQGVANTAVEWAGTRWTQILWPLPEDAGKRRILMAHELFHRIQPQLHLPATQEGDNAHLDTVDGRVRMQLEWRALTRALQASDDAARRRAAIDALVFRAARYQEYPTAAAREQALETNEGIAEYTGVMLGAPSPDAQRMAAIDDLTAHAGDDTFVRSFAYATGPAYGELLDRYAPGWRTRLASGHSISEMLAVALAAPHWDDPVQVAHRRMSAYGGRALHGSEMRRDAAHQRVVATYRAQFIDGQVLVLPLRHMQVQFDPRTLQPLGADGTVYPTLHLSDDWGTLDATSGALIDSDWSRVVVTAPTSTSPTRLEGRGWAIGLKPGWGVSPAERSGDLVLQESH